MYIIIFYYLIKVDRDGIEYEGHTYRLDSSFPADTSCHQKILGMGGACKVMRMFYHHCGCHSDEITSFCILFLRCDWCKLESNEKCYHFTLDTKEEIERKRSVTV